MIELKTYRLLLIAALAGAASIACGDIEELAENEPEAQVATTQQAFLGADLCKDVNIRIRNSRDRSAGNVAIKVLRLKMYSEQDNAWRSEDVPNRVISYGTSVLIEDQDLENVYAEDLREWKVYYQFVKSDGTWSRTYQQTVEAQPGWQCRNYRTYSLTVN